MNDDEMKRAMGRVVRTPGKYTVRMVGVSARDGVLVQTFEEIKTGAQLKAVTHPLPPAEAKAEAEFWGAEAEAEFWGGHDGE